MLKASVNVATATTTSLVAAPGAGKRIRVHGFFLVAAGAQTWKLQTATTDLFPACTMASGTPHRHDTSYDGIMECAANEALQIVTSAAVQLSGWISYSIRPA